MNKYYLGLGIILFLLGLFMIVVSIADIKIMPIIIIVIGLAEIVIGISMLLTILKKSNKNQQEK